MKNWTIKKRIVAGFATILVLVAALTVTSYVLLRQAKDAAHFMTVDAMPGLDAMSKINGAVGAIQINVLRDLMAKTPEEHKKYREVIMAARENTLKLMGNYESSITTSEDRELFGKLKEARDQYVAVRNQLLDLIDAGKMDEAQQFNAASLRPAFEKYDQLVDQELTLNLNNGNQETEQTVKATDRAMSFILGISVIVMIFGIVIATIITGGLNKVLRKLALSLDDGSNQTASAAGQVSAASQSLAEGASEQASSLEETSASLEETASMTKRNAENARQANDFAKQAREAADKGVGDMQTMSAAMEAIKVSSNDIAKIIKTIDEIAFQTNILALNAAVEAARAGEAGMGFAVVADEVRNLAQRSAAAAKETADKIEGAITKTGQGVEISGKVAAALNDIVTKVRQVDELVTEVANASREQTEGITQINVAVGQMDKVTQSNAANAEESAAAAEELNAQAETMKQSVAELLQLVGGSRNIAGTHAAPVNGAKKTRTFSTAASAPAAVKHINGNGHHAVAGKPGAAPRRDEIPMAGDFKNF
jgi:methyl-accepting chemotaxis protein